MATPAQVPFSVFEELLHRGDRIETPSTIHNEYRVQGVLDEHRLRRAIEAATALHPMTRARLIAARRGLRPPRWEIGDVDLGTVLRVHHCTTDTELDALRSAFCSERIDLATAPALRLLLVHRPDGDSLLLSAHHAITDGVGTLRFMHSVARAYAGRPDPIPAVDAVAVRALKVKFGRDTSPRSRPSGRPRNPRGTPTFVSPDGGVDEPGYGLVNLRLSSPDRRRLDVRQFGASATINDLMYAALDTAITEWNHAHGQPVGLVVMLMPVNFRPLDWYGEVVGNLTLGGRVMVTPEQRRTPDALMRAVMDRTQWLKTGGGGLPFLFRLPSVLYALVPLQLSLISWIMGDLRLSSVLSYYGRVDAFLPDFGPGAGPIIEVWGSPHVVLPTGIAIGAGSLKGELLITLRYCRRVLGDAAARRFGRLFIDKLCLLGTPGAGWTG